MSTYTPTHCPDTGRKFTKAERKAANKARYAAERVEQPPKPKSKRKPIKGDIHSEQFFASQEPTRKPKAVKVSTAALTDEAKLMKMTKKQLVALILFHDVPDPEPTPKAKVKAKAKRKATPAIKRPKRSSEAGLEQAQARTATAQRVGKVKKTKVVHAVTGKDAQPFEPRMEVPVEERKAAKREQMILTLLPGETPEEGIRRSKIQAASAELEATLLEAEQLTMNFEA